MTSIATNATDNVGCEVALLGTVVLAMSDLTTLWVVRINEINILGQYQLTVLASLVLVVTESTVESRQLTELIALELILTFGDGSGLIRW